MGRAAIDHYVYRMGLNRAVHASPSGRKMIRKDPVLNKSFQGGI
jgi:hypothetical protein